MTDKTKRADDFDRYRYGINSYVDGYKAGAAAVLTDLKNNAAGMDITTAASLLKAYCGDRVECDGCVFDGAYGRPCRLSTLPDKWRLDDDE